MALTLTAGYTWTSGEVDTATKRNSAAVPTVADGQTYAFGLGSAASPSQTFNGDTNTGAYSPGADQWAVAVAGVQVVAVSSTGFAVTGTTTSTEAGSGDGTGLNAGTATAGGNAGVSFFTAGSNRWTNDILGSADAESIRWRKRGTGAGTYMTLSTAGLVLAGQLTQASATLAKTSTALTDAAQSQVATITNAPVGKAGNPTKWVPVDDNGTTRYVPLW